MGTIDEARDMMNRCREARAAQREAEASASLATARCESYARLYDRLKRDGAFFSRIVVADAARKVAEREADAWSDAARELDEDAADCAMAALYAIQRGVDRGAVADEWSDVSAEDPTLTIDAYAQSLVDLLDSEEHDAGHVPYVLARTA